jgi:dGTPase
MNILLLKLLFIFIFAKNGTMNKQFIKMLSPIRFRDSSVKQDASDGRTPFDSDYSRVMLSSHFRRLQDKAQVFPLEKSDFVRTRLTHSLEVSCFAKGLGLGVEKYLLNKKIITEEYKRFIPGILEVSGLIHDIGNPPFGHFGEEVIRNYFEEIKNLPINDEIKIAFETLTESQKQDFCKFDGNVQGFRILRKLGLAKDEFSYNLTMPILSTIIKYPYSSIEGNKKKEEGALYSQKKFGFFESEKDDYYKIVDELGLKENQRHPLTYLLEAADDIAYSVSDIEDGYKLGIITLEKIKKAFQENNCTGDLNGLKKYESNMDLYIQTLRIKAQSKMLVKCTKAFNQKFIQITEGAFDDDLIKSSEAMNLRKAFEDLSIYNFSNIKVLKREILGQEVMSYLLKTFYNALFSKEIFSEGKLNRKSKEYKIYSLISENYKEIACEGGEKFPTNNYKKFMLVTDYISGMTDSYALNLYQELTGYSFYK